MTYGSGLAATFAVRDAIVLISRGENVEMILVPRPSCF